MSEKTIMEILYNTLYITINIIKFKEYVKKNNPYLYMKIYKEEKKKLTIEDIKKIIDDYGYEIVKEIKETQDKFSKTDKPGIIGKFKDKVRIMVIHYNALHQEDLEVKATDLWRPKTKNIKG